MTQREAYNALSSVRDEFEAAKFALGHVLRLFDADPVALGPAGTGLRRSDFSTCLKNLEITYIIRLFAVFEGILRNYYRFGRKRPTTPDMAPLMNSIAQYRHMAPQHLLASHQVRDFRNEIIHEYQRELLLTFHDCKSHLARYVSWLPPEW